MAATFTSTTNCIDKAGENADATIVADTTTITEWIEHAEAYVCARTFIDFRTDYSSFSTELKDMLDEVTSSLVAMRIITYNPIGYLTREADSLLNLNDGIVETMITALSKYKAQELGKPTGFTA